MKTIFRAFLSLLILILSARPVSAQADRQKAIDNFNSFGRLLDQKNADSAFYNVQSLAGLNVDLLNQLLHDSFAQYFLAADADTAFLNPLLRRMYTASTNRPLQQSAYPLYRWVEVRNNLADSARTRRAVTGFLTAQSRSTEDVANRIDRYALLIYRQLQTKPAYAALADTLFSRTWQRLNHAVNGAYYQAADDRPRREARAYFRYLTAAANHIKAEEAVGQNQPAQVETYRKTASAYSPDEHDRAVKTFTFYEPVFLFGNQSVESFHQPYIDLLLTKRDTAGAIRTLTELTLGDPGQIALLKTYYARSPVSGMAFSEYWTQALNAKLKPADPFQLIDLSGKAIDSKQYRGKWVLIDFWGTWCKPCVAELPHFQKVYDEHVKSGRQDLIILTVACFDTEPRVREFMQKQAYTFPVAMGNVQLTRQFRVSGYPTKILITPQGNRMAIPFGTNWAERLTIYTEN